MRSWFRRGHLLAYFIASERVRVDMNNKLTIFLLRAVVLILQTTAQNLLILPSTPQLDQFKPKGTSKTYIALFGLHIDITTDQVVRVAKSAGPFPSSKIIFRTQNSHIYKVFIDIVEKFPLNRSRDFFVSFQSNLRLSFSSPFTHRYCLLDWWRKVEQFRGAIFANVLYIINTKFRFDSQRIKLASSRFVDQIRRVGRPNWWLQEMEQ